jgi:hypothetical protein
MEEDSVKFVTESIHFLFDIFKEFGFEGGLAVIAIGIAAMFAVAGLVGLISWMLDIKRSEFTVLLGTILTALIAIGLVAIARVLLGIQSVFWSLALCTLSVYWFAAGFLYLAERMINICIAIGLLIFWGLAATLYFTHAVSGLVVVIFFGLSTAAVAWAYVLYAKNPA